MVEPPLCFRTLNTHICTSVVTSCVHVNHDLNQKLSNLGSSLHQACCHWFSLHFLCNLAYLRQTLKTFLMRFQWIEAGLNKVSNAPFRSCFWSYFENFFYFLWIFRSCPFAVYIMSFSFYARCFFFCGPLVQFPQIRKDSLTNMQRYAFLSFQLIAVWAKIYKSLKIQFKMVSRGCFLSCLWCVDITLFPHLS